MKKMSQQMESGKCRRRKMRTTRSQKTKGEIILGTERLAAGTSAEKSSKGKNEQCSLHWTSKRTCDLSRSHFRQEEMKTELEGVRTV